MKIPIFQKIQEQLLKAEAIKKRNKELGIPEQVIIDYINGIPSPPITEQVKDMYKRMHSSFKNLNKSKEQK